MKFEPIVNSTKNSYFGQFDTAGFPKDSAYVFRAEWTDYKKSPFVHIFPYWDFNPGQDIDVRVTSNAPLIYTPALHYRSGFAAVYHPVGMPLMLLFVKPLTIVCGKCLKPLMITRAFSLIG